ncbi:MAG: zinc ribbon domain-containing protein [Haloplanus sp.]
MSKITFRADDDLVERLEAFDASKSEVMRDALRTYLDGAERETAATPTAGRGDARLADRLDAALESARAMPDINVNVTLDGVTADSSDVSVERETDADARKTARENADDSAHTTSKTCAQCGENMDEGHVYCPNCGEKSSHRVFCDCGDELRSDWAFCPSCGRRTPAADVLDRP